MISKHQIKDFKARREYFERIKDKGRLRQLGLEEKDAWKQDLIQPSDNKFKSLYPKQRLEMEKGAEQRELQIKKDKQSREDYWKRFKNTTHHDAAKKVCQMN